MTRFLRSLLRNPLRWLALALPMLGTTPVLAQVSAYSFAASSGTFVPLPTATATAVPTLVSDDVISGLLPLGFNFVYDGTTYTQVKASSNGFLSFSATATANAANNFATGGANEKPLIAALWDDLDGRPVGAMASASYLVTGTAGSRVFTFEWLNWEWYYTANVAVISFQVKLYEGTNRIELVYRPETNPVGGAPSASIGLLSGASTGCVGEFLSLNNTSAAPTASSSVATNTINTRPAAGQVYGFTPPPPPTGSCAAVRCANVSNITGSAATLNFIGSPNATDYTITYQAAGGPVQTVAPAPTTSPVTLGSLALSTTYTATVRANCPSGASPVVTLTFTTTSGYCTTGNGTTVLGGVCGGNNITNISILGTTVSPSGMTCTNPVTGTAYTNYPATGNTTGTVFRGETYPISVTTTGNSIISAWIDFNHDFVFAANEWVQVATTTTAGTAAVASIIIPNTVAGAMPPTYVGPTGFRVRSRANGNINGAVDACTHFYSGETKDFTINIAPEPPCPSPNMLTATAITTTTATLNYNAVGAGTFTIKYGQVGFNPATGGTAITQTVTVPGIQMAALTGLQPGTGYQFYVQRNCGALGLSVNLGPVAFTTIIANDEPCGATQLPLSLSGCQPYATTSAAATATTPIGYTNPTAGCGVGANPKDVWFTFTTAASGPGSTDARVTVTGGPASVVQALSATSCNGPFTFIRCAGTANGVAAPNLDMPNLLPNTTYYVRVFGFSPASVLGNFSICVTPLPSCPTPTNLAATNVTKNSADLTWTAGLGNVLPNSTYTVVYGPPGFNPNSAAGTAITGITGTTLPLTNLASNTSFCYYVSLICGGLNGNSNQVGPTCFQTLLQSPVNDDPCGAISLTSGAANTAGTTVGATTSQQPGIALPTCSGAQTPRDVWYTVVTPPAAAGTDSLIINLSGISAGGVRVFSTADCANGLFSLAACQGATAANVGFGAPVRFANLLPGTTYYVAVSGYGSSDAPGTFNIRVRTSYVGPTCSPVTALAAGSLTTTSASLSFTPGVGNTSYTVTYGITGSTSTTVTRTGSPVALTGLTPGANYTVTVTPTCANGGSATGLTINFTTVPLTCNGVTGLAAGSITTTSAVLNFTAGAGNTSYTVTYAATGPTNTITPAPTAAPVALSNLLPGTTYTATVRPVCSGGGTAPASTITFTTLTPVCNSVTLPTVTNITSFTATLGFTAGAGNTSYTISYSSVGGPTVVVGGSATSVPLTGLQASTTYNVTITPTCSAGGTAMPTLTTFTTPAAPCAPVTQVAATGVTPTTASIGFTAGTGNTSYTVTYTPAGGMPTTVATSASPVPLTGLTPATNYTLSVVAICAAGGTAPAVTTTFNTPQVCNPVTQLAITNLTQSGAAVNFVPGTNNTSYTVTYQLMGGVVRTVLPAPISSPVTLVGLTPNSNYTVTVTPVCSGGGTATATTTTFTTPAPVCDPVTRVVATPTSPTSASVAFTPGAGNLSYSIVYAPLVGGTVVTVTATGSPFVLTNLTPNTPYSLTITPRCTLGLTGTGTTANFTTPLAARAALGQGLVTLAPNPAHHSATLTVPALTSARPATLTVLNPLGQVLRQQTLTLAATGTQALVDVRGLAAGVYLVQLRTADEQAVLRLLVE